MNLHLLMFSREREMLFARERDGQFPKEGERLFRREGPEHRLLLSAEVPPKGSLLLPVASSLGRDPIL